MTTKAETRYQNYLIDEIQRVLPGSFVMKNNPDEIQGIPDLIVLYGPYWVMLEVKASWDASHRPNQDYYIEMFDDMHYAAFVFPENEIEVLHGIQRALCSAR